MKSFCLITIFTITVLSAFAQNSYVDIHPDSVIPITTAPDTIRIDLDEDLQNDIMLFSYSAYATRSYIAQPMTSDIRIASDSSGALNFSYGDDFSAVPEWSSTNEYLASMLYNQFEGNWLNGPAYKYMAVMKISGNDTLLGWMRLSVSMYIDALTLHDYCIATTPGGLIFAGQGLQHDAKNVRITDAGNQMNGEDLMISFTRAADEVMVSGYRVFVVPAVQSISFGPNEALLVPAGSYKSVETGTGSDTSFYYGSSVSDINGDNITGNTPYVVFVLSVPDGTLTSEYLLSLPSDLLTLIAPPANYSDILCHDTGNNGNSSDLQVQFTPPYSLSGIGDIRVLFIPSDSSGTTLTIPQALSVNPQYTFESDTTSFVTGIQLPAGFTDTSGIPLQNGTSYLAFILCLPDGIHSDYPSLSEPSPLFILNNPNAFYTGQTSGTDVHYINLDPDTLLAGCYYCPPESYHFDFNADGSDDFQLEAYYSGGLGGGAGNVAILPAGNNAFLGNSMLNSYALPLPEGNMLFDGRLWRHTSGLLRSYNWSMSNGSYYYGLWDQPNDTLYLGLFMPGTSDTTFAWLRLTVTGPNSVILHDYAYYRRDSQNINNTQELHPALYPNPANDFIVVSGITPHREDTPFCISTLTGQKISSGTIGSDGKISLMTIVSGMYLLTIGSEPMQTFRIVKK